MATRGAIQALNDIRLAGLKEASEKRDVNQLMSWHSEDAIFTDAVKNFSVEGKESIRRFYTITYEAIPTFNIQVVNITCHSPEFVALELMCEGKTAKDLPDLALKAGDTLKLIRVSLFWWRWEGKGEEWNGDVSEDAVRGWKIVRERAYYFPVGGSDGKE